MCWLCRRVLIYSLPPCFFWAVFSESQIAAPYCFRVLQLSVLIFVGEEKERVWLDIHTFLVSCPSQHHLRKEWSSAPSKCRSLDNLRKERHCVCEIHVRAILRCDSWEWRVTASGFSISRLSGRDWCALPVSICSSFSFLSCGGFLFSFCSSGGPFSLLAACTDSLRYDRYAWTVGFQNFLPDRHSNYRQTDPRIESLRKNCPIFGKAYMFKVEFWLSVIFERQGFGFLCGAAWFRWSRRDRRFDQRRTITYFGDPSRKTCRRPAPGYAHGQVRTHGQTLLFYRYGLKKIVSKKTVTVLKTSVWLWVLGWEQL